MSITISEIARRIGCSPSTVSRALNATAGVAPQLRRRILVAARAVEIDGQTSVGPRRGRPRGTLGKSGSVEIIVFRREEVEPLILSASHLSVAPLTEATTNLFFSPRFRLVTDFYPVLDWSGAASGAPQLTDFTLGAGTNDFKLTLRANILYVRQTAISGTIIQIL